MNPYLFTSAVQGRSPWSGFLLFLKCDRKRSSASAMFADTPALPFSRRDSVPRSHPRRAAVSVTFQPTSSMPSRKSSPRCGGFRREADAFEEGKVGWPILQADAYAGYKRLYEPSRSAGRITEALCWSYGRRKFYELADVAPGKRRTKGAPPISALALEAVTRSDALFDIERTIRARPPSGAWPCAGSRARRSLRNSKTGCAPSAPGSRATPPWPKRWITCSSAGTASPVSSTMAASASRTTKRRGRSDRSVSDANHGCSRARSRRRAGGGDVHPHRHREAQRRRPPKPSSPAFLSASPRCRRPGCMNSSPGTGRPNGNRPSSQSLRPTSDAYRMSTKSC